MNNFKRVSTPFTDLKICFEEKLSALHGVWFVRQGRRSNLTWEQWRHSFQGGQLNRVVERVSRWKGFRVVLTNRRESLLDGAWIHIERVRGLFAIAQRFAAENLRQVVLLYIRIFLATQVLFSFARRYDEKNTRHLHILNHSYAFLAFWPGINGFHLPWVSRRGVLSSRKSWSKRTIIQTD